MAIPVTTLADSGPGSFRAAIVLANADPGSTIQFNVAGIISLLSTLPTLVAPTTVLGLPDVIIDGQSTVRIWSIILPISETVTLNRLRFRNGVATNACAGITVEGTILNLVNVGIIGCVSSYTVVQAAYGSALQCTASDVTVTTNVVSGTNFNANNTNYTIPVQGGAIWLGGTPLTLSGLTAAFNSNTFTCTSGVLTVALGVVIYTDTFLFLTAASLINNGPANLFTQSIGTIYIAGEESSTFTNVAFSFPGAFLGPASATNGCITIGVAHTTTITDCTFSRAQGSGSCISGGTVTLQSTVDNATSFTGTSIGPAIAMIGIFTVPTTSARILCSNCSGTTDDGVIMRLLTGPSFVRYMTFNNMTSAATTDPIVNVFDGTCSFDYCSFNGTGIRGLYVNGTVPSIDHTLFTGLSTGLYVDFVGTASAFNSTCSGNTTGILNQNNSTITSVTVSSGTTGIDNQSDCTIVNTIVANNTTDVTGTYVSLGTNLIENVGAAVGFGGTDILGVDPLLGPLAANGGPTLTQALLNGSPALNAGNNAAASLPFDQRGSGFARIIGGSIDIGAFENQAVVICLRGNTRVATPTGEVAIDQIVAGDQVITPTGPVTVIHNVVTGPQSRFYCMPNNAVAPGVPSAPLYLTGGHTIVTTEVLKARHHPLCQKVTLDLEFTYTLIVSEQSFLITNGVLTILDGITAHAARCHKGLIWHENVIQ